MRILITNVSGIEKARELGISMAATNFSHNLLSGGIFDKAYAILPTFVGNRPSEKVACETINVQYSFLRNTPFVRLAPIMEQVTLFWKIPRKANVWLYNLTIINALFIKLIRWFKPSVKIFPIVLDFTPGDPTSEMWLPLINSCNGRICLSTSDRFSKVNSAILPGVVPADDTKKPTVHAYKPTFLISGQLSDNISLLSRLLPVFSQIPESTLNITGNAPQMAFDYASKYPNIVCHGNVDYGTFLSILHDSTFLLSTRDPDMPENQCNFPSKIIEGLLNNRIIISTIDYPQLNDIKYLKIDANNMERNIHEIISMSPKVLEQYSNQGDAVRKAFSTDIWDATMKRIENNATRHA